MPRRCKVTTRKTAFASAESDCVRLSLRSLIATPEGPNIDLAATAIQRQSPAMNIIQLNGSVEIRTQEMTLQAAEADYNENTGEIEARGTARIRLQTNR